MKLQLALINAAAILGVALGEFSFLAKTLGSNMVLQRDEATFLYGYSARAAVTVSTVLNGEKYSGISASQNSKDGGFFWKIELPKMSGGFTKYNLEVLSSVGETALLQNVVFGDVFLCGGQSNMQFSMPGVLDVSRRLV